MEALLTFFRVAPIVAFVLIAAGIKLAELSGDRDGTRAGSLAYAGGLISFAVGVPLLLASGFAFSVWGEPW